MGTGNSLMDDRSQQRVYPTKDGDTISRQTVTTKKRASAPVTAAPPEAARGVKSYQRSQDRALILPMVSPTNSTQKLSQESPSMRTSPLPPAQPPVSPASRTPQLETLKKDTSLRNATSPPRKPKPGSPRGSLPPATPQAASRKEKKRSSTIHRNGSSTSIVSNTRRRSSSTNRPSSRGGVRPSSRSSNRPSSRGSTRGDSSSKGGRGELIYRLFRTKPRTIQPSALPGADAEASSPKGGASHPPVEVIVVPETELVTTVKSIRKQTNRNLIELRKREKERQEREEAIKNGKLVSPEPPIPVKTFSSSEDNKSFDNCPSDLTGMSYSSFCSETQSETDFDYLATVTSPTEPPLPTHTPSSSPPRTAVPAVVPAPPPRNDGVRPTAPTSTAQYNTTCNPTVTTPPVQPTPKKVLYYNKLTKKENYFNVHNHKLTNEEVQVKREVEVQQFPNKNTPWPQPNIFGPPLPPNFQTTHSYFDNTAVFQNNNNNPNIIQFNITMEDIKWVDSPVRINPEMAFPTE